jgi:RNA polymerase sigma-70 factor (sigma-E family)
MPAIDRFEGESSGPALEEFCAREWPRLVGLLGLYTGDRDLAEDLAQETLARLCRDWPKVSQLDAPGSWTYRVAFNLARSHFRRLRVRRRPRPAMWARESDPEDTALRLAVRDAVAQLPERQRATLVLRYFADLSVRDVATVLGCAEGTVKAQTSAAIEALRHAGILDPRQHVHDSGDD